MRTEQERMELIRKKTLEIRKKEQKRRQRIQDCLQRNIKVRA